MNGEKTIPYYYLYKQNEAIDELEFLHLEPLGQRSKPFNWQIEPHRHDHLFQILFLSNGTLDVAFDSDWEQCQGPAVITVPPKHIHGFGANESVSGYMITISESFLISLLSEADRQLFLPFFQRSHIIGLNKKNAGSQDIIDFVERIKGEYSTQKVGRVPIIGSYLRALLVLLTRCSHTSEMLIAGRASEQEVFDKFSLLLEAHYRDHWTLSQYCEKLGTTARRLGRICELVINKTPSEYIQDKVMIEAKCNLVYTLATVSHIAYELGFKDPAYFSRFFSKHAGMSPSEFILKYRK